MTRRRVDDGLARMTEAVMSDNASSLIMGSEPAGQVAQEWLDEGFDADTAPEWWAAGAWMADAAASLRDAGLNAGDCATLAGEGPCAGETIGYAVSNNDLNADRAAEIVAEAAS